MRHRIRVRSVRRPRPHRSRSEPAPHVVETADRLPAVAAEDARRRIGSASSAAEQIAHRAVAPTRGSRPRTSARRGNSSKHSTAARGTCSASRRLSQRAGAGRPSAIHPSAAASIGWRVTTSGSRCVAQCVRQLARLPVPGPGEDGGPAGLGEPGELVAAQPGHGARATFRRRPARAARRRRQAGVRRARRRPARAGLRVGVWASASRSAACRSPSHSARTPPMAT